MSSAAKAHLCETAFTVGAVSGADGAQQRGRQTEKVEQLRDTLIAQGKTACALAASTASSVSRRCRRVSGSDKPQTDGFEALLTVSYVDGDALPFRQAHDAGALQRRGVHENVLAALIRSDKAEALIGVVPLHRA